MRSRRGVQKTATILRIAQFLEEFLGASGVISMNLKIEQGIKVYLIVHYGHFSKKDITYLDCRIELNFLFLK